MKLDFYKPKSETLKKYIEGYYFLNATSYDDAIKYFTFPNNYCILAISLNSVNVFKDNCVITLPSKEDCISSSLVTRYTRPIEIILETPVNEVVFYFKPLGINRFIKDFQKLVNKSSANLLMFDGLEEIMKKVLVNSDRELQIIEIEVYWLSKLIEKDYSILEKVLSDLESNCSVGEISMKHNISRQHLLRQFTKSIGKSMSEYKKIERFRRTLIVNAEKTNLTEKAYENNFFDQSHLISDFKALTNIKPSKFFKEVDISKPTIWNFK
jgi:AraC-like DNA-binding protein